MSGGSARVHDRVRTGRPVVAGAGTARSEDPAGPGRTAVAGRRRRPDLLPYLLVSPLAVFILCLAIVPALSTLGQAFFRVNQLDPPTRFTGLGNFRTLAADPLVRAGIVNTAGYVVVGVALTTVLGILFAVTLQHRFRGRALLIAAMILPWALPGIVEGIIWAGIWDANSGLLNSVLSSTGLIEQYHVFLGPHRVLTIVLIELVQVWQITPLSALLVLAALQNIPAEVYESSQLDGCSSWGTFRRMTLPLARPGIAIAMVQALIATLNVFDQPYVLNGAAQTATSVTMQTYFVSFQNLDFGAGYALSLAITVVTLLASLVLVRVVYRSVEF